MDPLLATALSAADAAASVHARRVHRVGLEHASLKGFGDFVSMVDLESQEAALSVIRDAYPEHSILAEEGDPDVQAAMRGSTPMWVVDPLDGTKNFLHGHPSYAASVAVAESGRPLAGAVVASATGERWWARRGAGAWKNGRRLQVSSTPVLGRALVGTGFPFKALDLLPAYLTHFGALLEAGAAIRRAGAAALDLCYLAEGRFDAFWELHLSPWDFAAGALIVEEAGGVMSRVEGHPLELAPGSVMGAGSASLLAELADVVGGAGESDSTPE